MDRLGGVLGAFWGLLGCLGGPEKPLGGLLEASWRPLGASWPPILKKARGLRVLEGFLNPFGTLFGEVWGHFRRIFEQFSHPFPTYPNLKKPQFSLGETHFGGLWSRLNWSDLNGLEWIGVERNGKEWKGVEKEWMGGKGPGGGVHPALKGVTSPAARLARLLAERRGSSAFCPPGGQQCSGWIDDGDPTR